MFTGFHYPVDDYIESLLYPGQNVVYQRDTPYGSLVVAQQNEQVNFYENNMLICSDQDIKTSEETVHYAMTQHHSPMNVLLIGNGISGTLKEILKYDIERLDYVERNSWMIRLAHQHTKTIGNERVHVINKDARLYVKQTEMNYDVVILDIPEPVTAEMNRYYTLEFFRELKQCLNYNAIVSFSLASTADYVSEEAASLHSVIYMTASRMFKHVIIIPGGRNYFLCSNDTLTYRIPEIIEQKDITTDYVNKYYMDIHLLKQRSAFISGQLNNDAQVNKDFKPVGYLLQLNYWLSYFNVNYWIVISGTGLVLLVLLFVSVKKPVNMGLFFAGFTGTTLELVLLLTFQVIYGYVYHVLGIVIMVFMGGLAFGALYRKKFIRSVSSFNYSIVQFALGIFSMLLPFILLILKFHPIHPYLVHGIFFLLTFTASTLAGMIFNLASFQRNKNIAGTSSEIYSVDLWGAAAGALLVSAFLVPLLGLVNVALIAGVLTILSGVYSLVRKSQFAESN
jgi:spermidine synthase